jgi:pilus assembly protein CpaB
VKTKVALAAAIVLAVVAMVGFRAYLKRVNEAAQEGRKPYPVLVAARNIRADTEVLAEDMEVESREAASVPRMALTAADRERYRGRKVFRDIRRGDMLLASDFWQPAELEKFDKNEIAKGERAITVAVDQITGVAGLILPHSRVDLLGTFAMTEGGGPSAVSQTNFVTRTLLSNVRVLAIDRQTFSETGAPGGGDERRKAGAYSSVTLAVSPLEAEIITLAQSQGQGMLTLTLRNPVDTESSVGVPPVDLHSLDDAVKRADERRHPPKPVEGNPPGTP